MASFQKTQTIDTLNVKNIYVKGANNTFIPYNYVLTSDGKGGTMWTQTTGTGLAFDTISTSTGSYITGPYPSTIFTILNGPNAGLLPTGENNTVQLYANAFNEINVTGQSTLYAVDTTTNTFTSSITLTGIGAVNITTIPETNSIEFTTIDRLPYTVSTLITDISNVNTTLSTSIANFNSPYSNQPYIQYGTGRIGPSGTSGEYGYTTITIPNAYKDTSYIVQLTYILNDNTMAPPTLPLLYTILDRNTFSVTGEYIFPGYVFSWTTYGLVV
jgi:hypothetical protein